MKQSPLTLSGKKRRESDFYPTPPEATIALMQFLFNENIIGPDATVWESACGDGRMSEVIKNFCKSVYSSDIRFSGYGEGGIDFLNTKKSVDAIITNPPFNKAYQFIEKATNECKVVCLLLKSQYWHASKRCKLFNETKPAYVLPLTWRPDFFQDKKSRTGNEKKGGSIMEVIWNVWIKGSTDTKYIPLTKPSTDYKLF